MNLPNWVCSSFPSIFRGPSVAGLHPPLSEKYLKAPQINWKIISFWLRLLKKKAKSVLDVITSDPCSTEQTRYEFEFRLLIPQDETIVTNQASAWFITDTNELKLFTLWFSFLTQEQRHFYHDKRVNIQPNKPPCFKRPIMKNHWPSSKLAPALYHTEQFWAEKQNFLDLIRARHKHLVPVLHIKLYVRMS